MFLFKVFESTIMDSYLQRKLVDLCEFPKDQEWELKYRGTRDGLKAADFHKKCDGIAETLTVVKATNGNIFGGFAEKAWSSKNEWIADPKAFIFSLINKEEDPSKPLFQMKVNMQFMDQLSMDQYLEEKMIA